MATALFILSVLIIVLLGVLLHDLTQRKHAILRNFPVVGHLRYLIESIGPEIRQYIISSDTEERPFSRNQRRWVYSISKKENDEFGFGSDKDQEKSPNYLILKNAAFAYEDPLKLDWTALNYPIPCAKILGGARSRPKAFRPNSVVNISGMSFGSLSGAAVEAMNKGAKIAGCYQSTGEGGISRYHNFGGELVWNIGSGYFGCRDKEGNFDLEIFKNNCEKFNVKAVEIKLSQGAKPGLGGLLPGVKVTAEIAEARGIQIGQTCASPRRHTAFSNVDELLDFAEKLADASGLPIGI
ncbi:MAG: FMN-binding glutamate synthase family protein, partial [Methylococcales bacterium]|nr:FMN-binding glutamate synthase family protein [Methylococcales bacterium]